MRSPKNTCSEAVLMFAVWAVAPSYWNQQSEDANTVPH
jgi:hypothetical protein